MSTERYVNENGVVVDAEVKPDSERELKAAQVVAIGGGKVTVEFDGRRFDIYKRLSSLDPQTVVVGDWLLCCRVEQGVVALGEVV
jgi:hypothetical protein